MARDTTNNDSHTNAQLVAATLQASGDFLYAWDFARDQITWLGPIEQLFGGQESDRPGHAEQYQSLIHPEDLPARRKAISAALAGGGRYDCEYRLRDSAGRQHWVHDRGAAVLGADGAVTGLRGLIRGITERKQRETQLEYLASYDELTGHFNKQRLREALDQALIQCHRVEETGAFVVVGLDQMGRINNAYGHLAGDQVLLEIAQRLERTLGPADVLGRLGSDRFGIVLAGYDDVDAKKIAEQALSVIRATPVNTVRGSIHVTCSASLVIFPTQSKTSFDLIAKGEGALLMAKTAGRDCLTVYEMSEEQRRDQRESLTIAQQVKTALAEDRLLFAFQPVVDSKNRRVRFYECLLRMRDTSGDLVAAGQFVPVLEQLGIVRMIDRHTLEMVFEQLEANPGVTLAVNISALTVTHPAWLRDLTALLRDRPDLAQRLIVEITETAALYDIEESARFVANVRDLGCQVALDDFGAGFTTFRHLKSLTVDLIKIDGSFVCGIAESPENQLFVRNLLSLAQSFGLETVAECVETAEDANYLRQQGVELLQGYFFGRPDLAFQSVDEPDHATRPDDALRQVVS